MTEEDLMPFPDEPVSNPTEPESKKAVKKRRDPKLSILMLQVTACLLLAAMAVGIQFFGGSFYEEVRAKYIAMFADTTSVREVLDGIRAGNVTQSETVAPKENQEAVATSLPLQDVSALSLASRFQSFLTPVSGSVTSEYGMRTNPVTRIYSLHAGLDIAAETGTPVMAALDGTVESADYSTTLGYYVILSHGSGLSTRYGHLDSYSVSVGQTVGKGDTIGLVGSTGRSTGPHLHFEIRHNDTPLNPQYLLSDALST